MPMTHATARFEFEAEVTGGLEHPGIVPVYGLGHTADGRPFYAMRFIKGNSLKEAIRRFHEADKHKTATRASGRWRCAVCWDDSLTSARLWHTPIAGACCIEISSRATSCSANTARPWLLTGASPSRWSSFSCRAVSRSRKCH